MTRKASQEFDLHHQGGADERPHLKRRRRPPGSVRTATKTLSLPTTTVTRLEEFVRSAEAEGRSESWVAGDAIEEYLANRAGRRAART